MLGQQRSRAGSVAVFGWERRGRPVAERRRLVRRDGTRACAEQCGARDMLRGQDRR